MINFATILTLARIFAIPLFVIAFYLPWQGGHYLASIIFAFAALTDWLDGYIARNFGQITRFGAFLDPVADKLIVAVALVIIVGEAHVFYLAIPAAVIVGREIVISALREWMAEMGKRTSVAVSMVGKTKTLIQMIALFLLLLYTPLTTPVIVLVIGSVLLYAAALMTLWSMFMYLKAAWSDLTLR